MSMHARDATQAAVGTPASAEQAYEYDDTREVVALVKDAASLLRTTGEAAFREFRVPESRWRRGDTYVFVLDLQGNTLVHPDPAFEGPNQPARKDINGKLIIEGMLDVVTRSDRKREGWYHYEWPVPGAILPRWKSTYVELVETASGVSYVVGCGVYNDRMERAFVVDFVTGAVACLEKEGEAAFARLRDRTGPFIAKDAYVFVIDVNGVDLVNPGFPSLEGRNLLDVKDAAGKPLIREMFDVVRTRGAGWVDYMWPKPGESVSTQKSAYVSRARLRDRFVLVGSGVYLRDAPRAVPLTRTITASELMALVRDAARELERRGEQAYPAFREPGSRWFHDDIYLFVESLDGTRTFHAADPGMEGQNAGEFIDALGRPVGKMMLAAATSPAREGWVHYVYPRPGDIFPTWKSAFVKQVTFPSGKLFIVGCGIYNMRMDRSFIEDIVGRAAALIAEQGTAAFDQLRNRTGPFVFMDTYVFVTGSDGTQLVNAAQPSLEGRNLIDLRDVKGKAVAREEIAAAKAYGHAWTECYWFKPGDNTPARKQTYIQKVESGGRTYVVGSGIYVDDAA